MKPFLKLGIVLLIAAVLIMPISATASEEALRSIAGEEKQPIYYQENDVLTEEDFKEDPKEYMMCCLPAGTEITLFGGEKKPIEMIRKGDKVLSYDIERKEFVPSRVEKIVSPVREGIYIINDGILKLTDDHPVYVKKPDGTVGWAAVNPSHSRKVYDMDVLPLEVGERYLRWMRSGLKLDQ